MADDRQLAAKKFVAYWTGKGSEKSQSQSFWLSLLRDVYGVAQPEQMIDPLFLDDLTAEFDEIRAIAVEKTRNKRLTEFQEKLASLTFLEIPTQLLIQSRDSLCA